MNRAELRAAIARSGKTNAHLAEKLGITPESFSRKLHGRSQFRLSEVRTLKTELDLADEEVIRVFFCPD